MLGFDLDVWDYLTFLVIFALVGAFLTVAVLVLGLPGRIAIAQTPRRRRHQHYGVVRLPGGYTVDAGVHVGFQTHERRRYSLFPKTRTRKHSRGAGATDRADSRREAARF